MTGGNRMATRLLGIDVGSYKIVAVLADALDDGRINFVGINQVASSGIKKGAIANIEQAAKSIKMAVEGVLKLHGNKFDKVVVSLSGCDSDSLMTSDVSNIQNREVEIKQIEQVITSSQYKAHMEHDYDMLHTLPYKFILDDQNMNIDNPRGMSASRLAVNVHIITAKKSAIENLKKALDRAGFRVDNIVLSSYASSIATLTEDEKDMGVVLIDMGGATCDIIAYKEKTIRFNGFLGVGSHNITQDLSTAFHMPLHTAESIKVNYTGFLAKKQDKISVPDIGDANGFHEVPMDNIMTAIYARVEDTFLRLKMKLEKNNILNCEDHGKSMARAGIVLTGGMTKLDGIKEMASSVFHKIPIRTAKPSDAFINNISASQADQTNSCVLGLCLYSAGHFLNYEIDSENRLKYKDELTVSRPEIYDSLQMNSQKNQQYGQPYGHAYNQQPYGQQSGQLVVNGSDSDYLFEKGIEIEKEQIGAVAKFFNWLKNLF